MSCTDPWRRGRFALALLLTTLGVPEGGTAVAAAPARAVAAAQATGTLEVPICEPRFGRDKLPVIHEASVLPE